MAGLHAARILGDQGVATLVLEARPRIGGRILTLRDRSIPVPIELGAEFVHGEPRATWDLLDEAGLVAYDLPFDHFQRRRGRLTHLPSLGEELAPVMQGLKHLGRKDQSFADYLRHHRGGSPAARQMARAFVEGFDAADPERASAKAIAEEMEGIGNLEEEPQFRLRDGYGALIEHVRKALVRGCVTIRLRTVVSGIRWSQGRVEARCGSDEVCRARRAIITVPLGVLQVPPERSGSIRFEPEIPKVREAAGLLASGPVMKAILQFRDRFWEDPSVARAAKAGAGLRNAAFFHDPLAAFPTWWTALPLRVPMLTGWAGGPKAVLLSGLTKRELTAAALASLSQMFGRSVARLRESLVRLHFHDWPADPFSRGAYSYVTVGGSRARHTLATPVEGTLFFAGEAVDTGGQASTVAGAIASGERAARAVLRMRKRGRAG